MESPRFGGKKREQKIHTKHDFIHFSRFFVVFSSEGNPLVWWQNDRFGELLCVLPSVTPCSFFFLSTRMENRNVLSVYPLRAHTVKKKQSRSGAKINQIGISF